MSEIGNGVRCEFLLSQDGVDTALHVGSVLDLTLDIPEQYAGDGVGSLRCRGHVVSLEEAGVPGKLSVVCQVDELECEDDLWRTLTTGPASLH